MAVKIVRQVKNIALLGAPTSAAGLGAGQEGAPAALRSAGLVERLTAAGFQVTDYGDCAPRVYKPDDEHPRARNASEALAIIEELRPKVEIAVKSGALPVILAGDDTMVLAAIAGSRRYYRHVSVISMDRDAGLNVPATTPSGCLDGMVISHIVGRGAPELVRFWGEPPLIREPDVAVFGIDRVDQPEQKWLVGSPLQHYLAVDIKRRGAAVAAQEALERVHGSRHEFVLLLDLDAIAAEDFAATNFPGSGGLTLDEIRQAVGVFARQSNSRCVCCCRLQSHARYRRKGSEDSDRFAGRRAGSAFAGAGRRGERGRLPRQAPARLRRRKLHSPRVLSSLKSRKSPWSRRAPRRILPSPLCLPPNPRRRRNLPRRIPKANRPPSSSSFCAARRQRIPKYAPGSSAKGVPQMESTPCYVF